jgi:hypothetical protein
LRAKNGRQITARTTGAARLRRTDGGRRRVITVRVTDAEYDAITARAAVLGISRQRLMVEAATAPRPAGGPLYGVPASERNALTIELLGVRRLVAGLANNINQIARVANATGAVPAELPPAATATTRALHRLDAAVDALTPSRRHPSGAGYLDPPDRVLRADMHPPDQDPGQTLMRHRP